MDPVGPWYASYNRFTAGSTASTFQTVPSNTSADFVSHHLATTATPTVPSTTASQLLLQAAHTTATLAGQPTPFNPGGFLTPPSVNYDVFSPLFHHPNTKQAHYVTQHRQTLAQTQTVTPTKQNASVESGISTLRETYNNTHQSTFFEPQASATSPTSLAWSHQNNTQLPSPFGILPHESIVSSPGSPSTKSNNSSYENNFNAHFPTSQSLNNINSQLSSSINATEFKSSNYQDTKKNINVRLPSPTSNTKAIVSTSQASANQSFFQQVPTTFSSETLSSNYSAGNNNQPPNGKMQSTLQHQQSCIVSTPGNLVSSSGKEYRVPQLVPRSNTATTIFLNTSVRSAPVTVQDKQSARNSNFTPLSNKTGAASQQNIQSKAPIKVYSELNTHTEQRRNDPPGHDNNQSSPISFSIMDARGLNYAVNNPTNCNNSGNKLPPNQRTSTNNTLQTHNQQQQFHMLNQQQPQTTPYRHYIGSTNDTDYHHSNRSKSTASTDSAYSSTNSTQNGPDCGVVVPRRPSPLQAHSQASPLGHVPSPAYPMYNSPMATMSSPSPLQHTENSTNQCPTGASYKTGIQQQVAPPSPLDVTVPRPASQGQVAYPSVITRALGATENKSNYSSDSKNYERQQQDFNQTSKLSVCWENDNRQPNSNRKFSITTYPAGNNEMSVPSGQALGTQQIQRVLNVSDRQQPYFDTGQVTLQDLSSCRGDPMSIVKNLQNIQQGSCQLQQQTPLGNPTNEQQKLVEDRRKIDAVNKKRKNMEKSNHGSSLNELAGAAAMTEYLSRIPPPAHHNANQQQQNGYFDFERWNLPPPPSKMFANSSGAFSSQTTLHHSSNFVSNPAHQHQSLMVSHHTTPPIPYFPAFHIPSGHHSHHPHEYQSSVDITPVGFDNVPNQNSNFNHQDIRDDQFKIIVPNIEEELEFLQQNIPTLQNTNFMNKELKCPGKDPNSGFMTSYLKFLQGEREPSPTPAIRGGRKATWNRLKPYLPTEQIKSSESNTNGDTQKMQNEKSAPPKEAPIIDYANDPRYFPLPKERKKQIFDSSDDGFTSDDDFPFSSKKSEKKHASTNLSNNTESIKQEDRPRKGRPIKPGGPTDRKRKAAAAAAALGFSGKTAKKSEEIDLLSVPPRRETSKRKAKEKTTVKQILDRQQGIDYFDNDEEQGDSDTDPAWTPAAKLIGDEDEKRKKRGRPVISKRSKRIINEDGYSSGEITYSKKPGRKKHDPSMKNFNISPKFSIKMDEKLTSAIGDDNVDISPFKSGEFVVIKAELGEEYPPLWRIDGKTLLQKYEPFKSNDKTLYRNISTYSGWSTQNHHLYQQAPVKFWQQGKTETIVEFLRDEMIIDDSESIEKFMKEAEKYQDNFEVYIQTLISQALDSNFLTEIFQEQDDYFLSNVKTVDEITEEKKKRILSTTKWCQNIVTAISTWPCLNILKDISSLEHTGKTCAGCQQSKIYARVLLYGQPYNSTTLEGSPPDPRVPQDKDFLFCQICQIKVSLYNKVSHQKYLMFLECARRVADKRMADPHKDTTIILNELLADEVWLNQLFKDVRHIWAEIDSIEEQIRAKFNSSDKSSSNNAAVILKEKNESAIIHTPKEMTATSDPSVPMQIIENNFQTVSGNEDINNASFKQCVNENFI